MLTPVMGSRNAKILIVTLTCAVILAGCTGYFGWQETLTFLYRMLRFIAILFVH